MHPLLESYFKFIKKLILTQGDDGVIGLDIGVSMCRAVAMRRKQDGFELMHVAAVPVEAADEKSAVIKVLDQLGPLSRTKPLVVSVSGKGTLIRHIDMPRMSYGDLRKSFAVEADKYFPFPKETVFTDCFILDPKAKDKKMAVLIAAVKKDVVEPRLKMLAECGIDPAAVTIASVASANTFAVFPPPMCGRAELGGKAVAIVDIGENFTNLMIMSDGIPRFMRDVFIGTSDIVRRLANMTGMPLAEARALCAQGCAGGRAAEVQKSVDAVLTNLILEIRLSFDYFMTEKNLPIGRICLIGDGVGVDHLEAAFASGFDMPFVVWAPMPILAADVDQDLVAKENRRMIVAMGLALGEYDQA